MSKQLRICLNILLVLVIAAGWLFLPGADNDYKYAALIGPGQATGSTGGLD